VRRTWFDAAPRDAQQAVIARAVQTLAVTRLMDTAANDSAATQVRADANAALRMLADALKHNAQTAAPDLQHVAATVEDIERFLSRPDAPRKRTPPPPTPPGDPIGAQPPPN
jgi:hypothetical protein